tara:strand:- start:409 stop:951 length:543 start_codon:yes stop_codon:yes gene_type:complete
MGFFSKKSKMQKLGDEIRDRIDAENAKLTAELEAKYGKDIFVTLTKEEEKERLEEDEREKEKDRKAEQKRISTLKASIKKLLKNKAIKMPASDIDAHLKHQNIEEIKELCEEMYHNGEISRTGNYRYFILTEKKKPKKAAAKKLGSVDVKAELKKYKEMLDEGLIEQEDYDAKKKELLGL